MKYLFIFLPFFAMAQGGDSTLYGVRVDSIDIEKLTASRSSGGFYYGTKPEDGSISLKNDTLYRFVKVRWTPCDQHFGEVNHPKRDKIEQSEVKILVWTGCALTEYRATKFYGYNYYDDQFFMSGGAMKRVQKDFISWYLAGDKWIKPSHVIKEL